MRTVCILHGRLVQEDDDGRVFATGHAEIDADGSPHAYHPDNTGLDYLGNAKDSEGRWCGILTDRHGEPLVQGSDDPAPGFYISTTSYENRNESRVSQRRYLDASTVPYIVIAPAIRRGVAGIVLGCRGRITDTRSGKSVDAVAGDVGPEQICEMSIAAAIALGIPSSPKTGGCDAPVFLFELWPGVPAVVNGVTYELQPA